MICLWFTPINGDEMIGFDTYWKSRFKVSDPPMVAIRRVNAEEGLAIGVEKGTVILIIDGTLFFVPP